MPKRGEVYWVDFGTGAGFEQQGRRPAVVVQNDRGNRSAGYTVVAVLSAARSNPSYPFLVHFDAGTAGLKRPGHVNCSHLHTVDLSRLQDYVGAFDADE
jgi:mRNA interferase MazF